MFSRGYDDTKIAVLVVESTAVGRRAIAAMLAPEPDIEIMPPAASVDFARRRLKRRWPDVVILDAEMAGALDWLREIMRQRPTPVLCLASGEDGAARSGIQALQGGAVEILAKASLLVQPLALDCSQSLVCALRRVSGAEPRQLAARRQQQAQIPSAGLLPRYSADVILPAAAGHSPGNADAIVAIGASTGGTHAIEALLTALPASTPGIVIVQHMPEMFTAAFAERLNGICALEVREAESGDTVRPGLALIAPGGNHLVVRRFGPHYRVEVIDGPPVNRHRPAVDVLFRSVAQAAGEHAIGVILTGMGDDGARGLVEMRAAGAQTIAQDRDSCVVYGMPAEAVKRGGAERVLPLDDIRLYLAGLRAA